MPGRVLLACVLLVAGITAATWSAGPAARAADVVLVPPTLSSTPDRAVSTPVAACGGTVLCVGQSGDFGTIGEAVAAAGDGDTIQVQAGTYAERVVVSGKEVRLYGGFAPGFGSRNPATNVTTIDGGDGGTTVTFSEAGDAVLDGFTVTGGKAPLGQYDEAVGSGIRVEDSGAVTISHNIVEGNDDGFDFTTCGCTTEGGGLYAASWLPGSTIDVVDNVFRDNGAHRGAAMFVTIPALIEGNLIEDNVGRGDHGGGLFLGGDGTVLRQNLVRGNEVGAQAGYGWGGGGIFVGNDVATRPAIRLEANRWVGNDAPSDGSGFFIDEAATGEIVGDLFHDNVCGEDGAGLYLDGGAVYGSSAVLENVTITRHTCPAGADGSGIFAEGGSRFVLRNSIVTGNGGDSDLSQCQDCQATPPATASLVTYSLIGPSSGAITSGTGVLAGAPGFVDAAGGDFHLTSASQAIDRADPASTVGAEPTPHGGRRNLGAYGGTVQATTSGADAEPDPALPPPGADVWDGSCADPATGTVFEVGPGRAYTSIGAVPWQSLGPGDRVRIHRRAAPYREKILISEQGTAAAPITVCGVPDGSGNRPVIDGAGATTRPGMESDFALTQTRGLITFATKEGDPYGTKPEFVVVDGFELTGAFPGNTFTDHDGNTQTYPDNAAALFVERGETITFRNNLIHDNGNGIFVASGDAEESVSRHILVEGNELADNSVPGRDREHHSYIEAEDTVYQFNHYRDTSPGALGGALKDRSAGTVVRYNWIEGGARALDLVESQEGCPILCALPAYRSTWVYGNVIDVRAGDATNTVHYGGDGGATEYDTYRKGTLYFFNNTVSYRVDQADEYNGSIFDLETTDETVEAWGNAFHVASATPGQPPINMYLTRESGTFHLGENAFSPSVAAERYVDFDGTIVGFAGQTRPAGNDFGFTDLAGDDFRPASGSPLVDVGSTPPVTLPTRHRLRFQYVAHRLALGRLVNGGAVDLGYYERGPAGPVTEPGPDVAVPTFSTTVPGLTYGRAARVSVTVAGDGVPARGQVTLLEGGRTLDAATLSAAGAASLDIAAGALTPDSRTLVVRYGGSAAVEAGSTTRAVSVAEASVNALSLAVVRPPRVGRRGKVEVVVDTPAGLEPAAGQARLRLVRGEVVRRAAGDVVDGTATIRLPRLARGRWTVRIRYRDDPYYRNRKATVTIRVRR